MPRLRTELRLLRAYTSLSAAAMVVLALTAFRRERRSESFDVITAHRINIVEPDGKMRLLLSDRAEFPKEIVLDGKTFRHERQVAGLLFYNDEGEENGGLTYGGERRGSGYEAFASLTFDRFRQDQVLGLQYSDQNGRRSNGFTVWDRPDRPLSEFAEAAEATMKLPEGARRDSAQQAVTRLFPSPRRLFAGRDRDGNAVLNLNDGAGRTRLRLVVDSAGGARLEFMDTAGKVTRTVADR